MDTKSDETVKRQSPSAPTQWDDVRARLPILLVRARQLVNERFRDALRTHNLSEQQFRILWALDFNESMDVSALATGTDLLQASVSRILRDLGDRGLIARSAAPDDARRTMARLTPAGRQALRETMVDIDAARGLLEQELGDGLADRARTVLLEVIARLQ